MGSDKALMPFGGGNLLQLALRKAKTISTAPVIVGSQERYSAYGDVIEDQYAGCGPLGGIHAALCATQSDVNLVLSVDMPLMSGEFLSWLAQVAASGRELAVVPETEGRLQPLCSVYRRPARCVVEQALKNGDFKVADIFPLLPTRYISEAELRVAGFLPEIFLNINTPADYEALARAMMSTNGHRDE
jgi:molybdopterin-guanine dinucleotide biosynthesis protein A